MVKKVLHVHNATKKGFNGNKARKGSVTAASLLALESRILFDGAAVATVASVDFDAAHIAPPDVHDSNADHSADGDALFKALADTGSTKGTRTEIAFVDSRVEDYGTIVASFSENVEVYVLDSAGDGVEQIASVLSARHNVDAVHIISHGRSGTLDLGNAKLTAASIAGKHADEMAVVRDALSDDGDILIYGCNFGQYARGEAAVEALAEATGADVAASDDLTGAADRGGDWDLETQRGEIDTRAIAATDWDGLLAPLTISATGDPTVVFPATLAAGASTVWTNAGSVGGTAIDLRATVVSVDAGVVVTAFTSGDDPSIALDTGGIGIGGSNAGSATIRWEVFESGTGQTVAAIGALQFTVSDIDGSGVPNTIETVAPSLNGLQSYEVDAATALNITTGGGLLTASGTDDDSVVAGGPLRPSAAITFVWSARSSWDVTYTAERAADGRVFSHDGDGDFVFVNGNVTTLLGIDLDGNDSTAAGTAYTGTFAEGAGAVPVVDGDVTISQHVVLGTTLDSATVRLTNAQAGDVLATSALPAGISANVDTSVACEITVTLSGNASVADYETALQAVSPWLPTAPAMSVRHRRCFPVNLKVTAPLAPGWVHEQRGTAVVEATAQSLAGRFFRHAFAVLLRETGF